MKVRAILLEEDDEIALRTRIHLFNDRESYETERLAKKVVKKLGRTQLPDGSWERTLYATLSHLHLLIDIAHVDTPMFRKGFTWILSLKGPMGFHEYWEEGMTIHARDVNCPYGCKLGTPEFSGRVLYLFGRQGYDDPVVDETIHDIMQFHRDDGGFHGPRFWEEDKKSCPGATLWATRGLLSLGREQDTVERAVAFIEREEIADTPYQYSTSALTLETLHLYTPHETASAAKHIEYLLSLREGEKWRFESYNETRRQTRANIFTVLSAVQKFRPRVIDTLQ
jgi:hypothetical protein